jgi:hypothetical protein
MTPPLASRQPDNPIHRISRRPDAWAWPDWAYAGEDGTFGNRYDDPRGEYRVLYASGQRIGPFLETLARYRPDPAVIAAYAEIGGDERDEAFPTIAPGLVPAEWLERRCIGTASHHGRFADVGHSDSLAHLRVALADRVLHHRLGDLDGAELRRRAPRAFTQEISRYVFETAHEHHDEPVCGIGYLSRLGDELENWAIFEPSQPDDMTCQPLERADPDLQIALDKFDLMLG